MSKRLHISWLLFPNAAVNPNAKRTRKSREKIMEKQGVSNETAAVLLHYRAFVYGLIARKAYNIGRKLYVEAKTKQVQDSFEDLYPNP